MEDKKKLTTAAGAPVPDNDNAMTAGPRGPMLLQDVWYLEKLAHFDREVIPERRMVLVRLGPNGNLNPQRDYFREFGSRLMAAVGESAPACLGRSEGGFQRS